MIIAKVKKKPFVLKMFLRISKVLNNKRRIIKGKNNHLFNDGTLINYRCKIKGNNNSIRISKGAILNGLSVYFNGDNHSLFIGENCRITQLTVCFEDENCSIEIGKNTTMEPLNIAVTEPHKSVTIGNDCMFSYDIEFKTGDSHSIIDLETKKRINYAGNIIVGDHVWIGAEATILKGVTIGNNSIVSAKAIVTQSIPPHSIAAGVPARVVKSNIDWLRQRIYENRN